jgi:hypothetical protein
MICALIVQTLLLLAITLCRNWEKEVRKSTKTCVQSIYCFVAFSILLMWQHLRLIVSFVGFEGKG